MTATCARFVRLLAVLAAAIGFHLAGATGAHASSNISPSTAVEVEVGTPFTGAWPGTKKLHGCSPCYNHWWKLPAVMRTGDHVEIAVDNRDAGKEAGICLVPPVDGFDADEALSNCDSKFINTGRQARETLSYTGESGRPFLVINITLCCGGLNSLGSYTITAERIVSRVNAGMSLPQTIRPDFSIEAQLTYGDNTPADDGITAHLQWRLLRSGDDQGPFEGIATSKSSDGAVAFTGRLPSASYGNPIQMRTCVRQPGSDSLRCSAATRTRVANVDTTHNVFGPNGRSIVLLDKQFKVNKRKRIARMRVACRRVSVAPPCGVLARLVTQRRVPFRGERRRVELSRTTFTKRPGKVALMRISIGPSKWKLLRENRRARRTFVVFTITDGSGRSVRTKRQKYLRVW